MGLIQLQAPECFKSNATNGLRRLIQKEKDCEGVSCTLKVPEIPFAELQTHKAPFYGKNSHVKTTVVAFLLIIFRRENREIALHSAP